MKQNSSRTEIEQPRASTPPSCLNGRPLPPGILRAMGGAFYLGQTCQIGLVYSDRISDTVRRDFGFVRILSSFTYSSILCPGRTIQQTCRQAFVYRSYRRAIADELQYSLPPGTQSFDARRR